MKPSFITPIVDLVLQFSNIVAWFYRYFSSFWRVGRQLRTISDEFNITSIRFRSPNSDYGGEQASQICPDGLLADWSVVRVQSTSGYILKSAKRAGSRHCRMVFCHGPFRWRNGDALALGSCPATSTLVFWFAVRVVRSSSVGQSTIWSVRTVRSISSIRFCRVDWDVQTASIFRAELYALLLVIDMVQRSKEKNFVIFSDSMSSLQSIYGCNLNSDVVRKFLKDYIILEKKWQKQYSLLDPKSCGNPR